MSTSDVPIEDEVDDLRIADDANSIAAFLLKTLIEAFKLKENREPTTDEIKSLYDELTEERIAELMGDCYGNEFLVNDGSAGNLADDISDEEQGSDDDEESEDDEEISNEDANIPSVIFNLSAFGASTTAAVADDLDIREMDQSSILGKRESILNDTASAIENIPKK